MINVRPATPADASAIEAVHRAAFSGESEAKLAGALVSSAPDTISVVAEKDGKVVGHALLSPMTLTFQDRSVRTLALAPVGVLPEHQRERAGAALIQDALGRAAGAGWEAVVVLGDPAYYERFGFAAASVAAIESPYAGPHLMGLELKAGALKGAGGKMSYPAAFNAL